MKELTRAMIKDDLGGVLTSLENDDVNLVPITSALKISFTIPLLVLFGYSLSLAWLLLHYGEPLDPFGEKISFVNKYCGELVLLAFTALFSMLSSLSVYKLAIIYLSVPKETRESSFVINRAKKFFMLSGVIFVLINWLLAALACLYDGVLIGAAPLVYLTGLIVIQSIANAEISRLGMAEFMRSAGRLIRKI